MNLISIVKCRLGNILFKITSTLYYYQHLIDTDKQLIFTYHGLEKVFLYYRDILFPHINFKPYYECKSLLKDENTSNEKNAFIWAKIDPHKHIIDGWRMSPLYWNNDTDFALSLFRIKPELKDYILNVLYKDLNFSNVVSVHIRRGDYVYIDYKYNMLPLYILDKMMKQCEGKQFLILSDDIKWCKENIKGDNIIYADREINDDVIYNREIIDLYTMTLCCDNIISNSSFSWWGAYLNENKGRRVFYTMPWTKFYNGTDIIPKNNGEWIKI